MNENANQPITQPGEAIEWAPYADIIDLPHHESTTHPRMSARDRAAQFAPFAALSGYGKVITETEKDVGNFE